MESREWEIDGIAVAAIGIPDMDETEARKYVDYVLGKVSDPVSRIAIRPAPGGDVELVYEYRTAKFERIRRITGR